MSKDYLDIYCRKEGIRRLSKDTPVPMKPTVFAQCCKVGDVYRFRIAVPGASRMIIQAEDGQMYSWLLGPLALEAMTEYMVKAGLSHLELGNSTAVIHIEKDRRFGRCARYSFEGP